MPIISADQADLRRFFNVEPMRLDPDIPWSCNHLNYEAVAGDLTLQFALAPMLADVRIVLRRAEAVLYELNALAVADVRYHDDSDLLEVQITTQNRLWLRLRPVLSVVQEADHSDDADEWEDVPVVYQ